MKILKEINYILLVIARAKKEQKKLKCNVSNLFIFSFFAIIFGFYLCPRELIVYASYIYSHQSFTMSVAYSCLGFFLSNHELDLNETLWEALEAQGNAHVTNMVCIDYFSQSYRPFKWAPLFPTFVVGSLLFCKIALLAILFSLKLDDNYELNDFLIA